MGGKYVLFALVFLIACTPQADVWSIPSADRVQDTVELADACEGVTCPAGQLCTNGACGCPTSQKQCAGGCISEDACCTHDDCPGAACENGACVTQRCAYGEVFENGECGCPSDAIYCSEQGKCIDKNACCFHTQCPSFERCVPTQYRSRICVEFPEKIFCGLVSDTGRVEVFNVLNYTFRVQPTAWYADESIDFVINEEDISIAANNTIDYGDAELSHEAIEVFGGYCKEDEDN